MGDVSNYAATDGGEIADLQAIMSGGANWMARMTALSEERDRVKAYIEQSKIVGDVVVAREKAAADAAAAAKKLADAKEKAAALVKKAEGEAARVASDAASEAEKIVSAAKKSAEEVTEKADQLMRAANERDSVVKRSELDLVARSSTLAAAEAANVKVREDLDKERDRLLAIKEKYVAFQIKAKDMAEAVASVVQSNP